MKTPLIWTKDVSNEHEERNIFEQQQYQGIINSSQVEEREMYIGSRISHAQCEAMEEIYRGSIHDIKEGCMIAVLANGDANGYPFWVAKVIKVITKNEDVVGVEVHWYATNTHPFSGVYKSYMVADKKIGGKRKRKGKNINHHHTNLLKLEDVDILVHDFNLTKRGTLLFKMIEIVKRLLSEETMLRWESIEPSHRSRRILKPKMVGMHVESYGELVDEREKCGTLSSASSHSFGDVNFDCVQENMSDFE